MRRRTAALALALLAALAAPLTGGAASAQSVGGPPQAPGGSVRATITEVGPPMTPDPSSVLQLRATIVNDSSESMTRVRWRLRIGAPVTTRVGLTTAFQDRGASEPLWHDDLQVIDVLAAGEHHDVALFLPLDLLENFPEPIGPAVYPIRFEVTHRLDEIIATADTFLIWFPQPQPTLRIGWLVAITDLPARDSTFAVRGDDLEKSVSAGGRLDGVLTALDRGEQLAGALLPLTLAVDAELVESVRALGSPAAAAWLARLKQLAAKHPVIALPYADADLVALVRARLGAEVAASLGRGRERLDALLGITSVPDVAWPVGEVADAATVNELADNGIGAVVLDRLTFKKSAELFYTATAVSEIDTSTRRILAVVPDAPVTSLATDMAAGGGRFAVARQRLLAETAVIQQQWPDQPRDIFVRFPRDWAPADAAAAAALLALPDTTPWLTGTTLPEAVARPARAGDRSPIPRYPGAARAAELPADSLRAAHDLRADIDSFRQIFADGDPPAPGTNPADRVKVETAARELRARLEQARDALLWTASVRWRGNPGPANALRSAVAQTLQSVRSQVFVETSAVRLTSTSGPVPITVRNRLGLPVHVRVTLRSTRFGLTFGRVSDITVPAAGRGGQPGSASVQVPFTAQTVGKFLVDAQLLTVDNVELGPPARITVNTTAYGRLALVVTIGAFLLLVLASLVRFVFRRRRDGRAGAPDDGPGQPGSDEGPARVPESVDASAPA